MKDDETSAPVPIERDTASRGRRGQEQLILALEKLPVPAYTCDPKGLITYFNDNASQLWGRSPRLMDPIDRFCGSFKLFSSEGTPIRHDECWMARALTSGKVFNGEQIIVERPDGRRRSVLAHANPIRDVSGRLIGAVNILIDVTDRTSGADELPNAEGAKDELLSTLGRELRLPLAPLRRAVSTLQLDSKLSAAAREAVQVIERQLLTMTRLIDDLLDADRIATSRVELYRELVDVSQAARLAVETSRAAIDSAHHQLVLDLPSPPIYFELDLMRMAEVISHLLNNAARYTPPGGRIELAIRRDVEGVMLSVRDNGVGICSETLPRIFETFIQVAQPLTRFQTGAGSGLPRARQLVVQHGGTIEAHSAGIGQGSEFIIHLPIARAGFREASGLESPPLDSLSKPSLKILVVDDDPDSTEMLTALLRLTGHSARAAHEGHEAVRIAEDFRPEVVLLDLGLPGIDGYEVARRIRKNRWSHETMLIAVSGWGLEEDRRLSRQAGFDHHLVKPVDPTALCQMLLGLKRRGETPG